MDIHISRKGEQFGPYTEAVARQYMQDGTLAAADMAWHAGADGWKPLGEVLGIATQPPAESTPPAEPTTLRPLAPAGDPYPWEGTLPLKGGLAAGPWALIITLKI